MADKIKLVQGDTKPALICTITDDSTGNPIAITGATVRLKFRAAGSETVKNTITGTVTDGVNGVCAFYWATDPTSLQGEPGDYEGEIEVTFQDGTIQTVYDVLKFKLRQQF